jgi:hypothetical protein
MTVNGANVPTSRAEWPLRFDLGADALASQGELTSLPQDWDSHGLTQRDHGGGRWPPADPAQLEILATTLDVPGF